MEKVKFTRVVEKNNRPMAEVRVQTGNEQYIAYFSRSAHGQLEMPVLLKNDADRALDWYDNDLHQAFEEVTDSGDLERLRAVALNYGDVQHQVEHHLP